MNIQIKNLKIREKLTGKLKIDGVILFSSLPAFDLFLDKVEVKSSNNQDIYGELRITEINKNRIENKEYDFFLEIPIELEEKNLQNLKIDFILVRDKDDYKSKINTNLEFFFDERFENIISFKFKRIFNKVFALISLFFIITFTIIFLYWGALSQNVNFPRFQVVDIFEDKYYINYSFVNTCWLVLLTVFGFKLNDIFQILGDRKNVTSIVVLPDLFFKISFFKFFNSLYSIILWIFCISVIILLKDSIPVKIESFDYDKENFSIYLNENNSLIEVFPVKSKEEGDYYVIFSGQLNNVILFFKDQDYLPKNLSTFNFVKYEELNLLNLIPFQPLVVSKEWKNYPIFSNGNKVGEVSPLNYSRLLEDEIQKKVFDFIISYEKMGQVSFDGNKFEYRAGVPDPSIVLGQISNFNLERNLFNIPYFTLGDSEFLNLFDSFSQLKESVSFNYVKDRGEIIMKNLSTGTSDNDIFSFHNSLKNLILFSFCSFGLENDKKLDNFIYWYELFYSRIPGSSPTLEGGFGSVDKKFTRSFVNSFLFLFKQYYTKLSSRNSGSPPVLERFEKLFIGTGREFYLMYIEGLFYNDIIFDFETSSILSDDELLSKSILYTKDGKDNLITIKRNVTNLQLENKEYYVSFLDGLISRSSL